MIRIHPETPEKRIVGQVLEGLQRGRIYIAPTDTVYAVIGLASEPQAINEIYRVRNLSEGRPLALLCRDISMAARYAADIPRPIFRFMKHHTPGPYTFLLRASREFDRRGMGKKREVGVRIVDHPVIQALLEQLDTPLVSASLTQEEEYVTDPGELEQQYGKRVAGVIDGGVRSNEFSTVIDCLDPGGEIRLVRQGLGPVDELEELLL